MQVFNVPPLLPQQVRGRACGGVQEWFRRGLRPGKSSTLNPKPYTLNPEPSTLNPQPSALNPQPSTLNPQPSTLDQASPWRCPCCLGTSAEVFTWARLVEPQAPKEIGEALFKEANAPARRPDEEEPERPAGKGKGKPVSEKGSPHKEKGSPLARGASDKGSPLAKKRRGGKAAVGTPKTPGTPVDSSCDSPSGAVGPKKRGRPPKVKAAEPESPRAAAHASASTDAGDGGDEEEENIVRSSTRERKQRVLED